MLHAVYFFVQAVYGLPVHVKRGMRPTYIWNIGALASKQNILYLGLANEAREQLQSETRSKNTHLFLHKLSSRNKILHFNTVCYGVALEIIPLMPLIQRVCFFL